MARGDRRRVGSRRLVRDLGADDVVRRGPDVAERVRELVSGGVDAVAGRIGAPRGITIHPVWVAAYGKERAKLDRLREQVEAGEITLRVARTFPAEQAGEAHRVLATGGVRGRLVLEL